MLLEKKKIVSKGSTFKHILNEKQKLYQAAILDPLHKKPSHVWAIIHLLFYDEIYDSSLR